MKPIAEDTIIEGLSRVFTRMPVDPNIAALLLKQELIAISATGEYTLTQAGEKLCHWPSQRQFGQPLGAVLDNVLNRIETNPKRDTTMKDQVDKIQKTHGVPVEVAIKMAASDALDMITEKFGVFANRHKHHRYREATKESLPIDRTAQIRDLVPSMG